MFPGINPRLMKQAMKKMGMKQEEIEATEVIIKTPAKELVFTNPSVAKIDMMGQESYQITGEPEERELSSDSAPDITEDDIKTVMEQADCSEEEARAALKKSKGDIAEAILDLKEKE